MSNTINKDKIYGSIFGGFVGDALGFPIEGHSRKYIIDYYIPKIFNHDILKMGRGYNEKTKLNGPIYESKMNECSWFYKFGQYTDDSQLSRLVLETIIENNGTFEYAKYGHEIGKIFDSGKIVGLGKSSQAASKKLLNGLIDYKFSGTPNAITNGSAMRSDIFGVLFHKNAEQLYEVVTTCSMMTHMSSKAVAGSLCISAFVATALNLNNKDIFDPDIFINNAIHLIKNVDREYMGFLLQFRIILKMNELDAYNKIKSFDTVSWGKNKISSGVVSSTLYSIYCFLKNYHSYSKCIIMALSAGGDVDTIAKMAGSISGAYLGISHIPNTLIKRLNDNNAWNANDISKMIDKVLDYEIKIKK